MELPVRIRNAERIDIEAMTLLLEELFALEADFDFNPERQRRGLSLLLDGCGKHRAVKVAEAGNDIVGMCTAQTLISTARGGVVAIVEDMVVRREWRGRKIGSMLLSAVENWAFSRGIERLQLLADKNNSGAFGFYRKMAWQETSLVCLRRVP